MRHRRRFRWFAIGAATLVAAGVLYFLLQYRSEGFDFSLFFNVLRRLDPRWLAAAVMLAIASYAVRALRWEVLIRPQKDSASLWNLFSATAVGFTAIVLFGRPGEMIRPYLIATKERLSFPSQMAVWLLERIYDLLTALIIFGFALARVQSSGAAVGDRLQWALTVGGYVVGILSTVCLLVLFMLRMFTGAAERRLLDALGFLPPKHLSRAEGMVKAFTEGVGSTRSNWAVAQVFLYSVLEWAVIVGCYICVFRASPVTLTFGLTDIVIFVGFVSFGNIVQIPGIGGGLQIVTVAVLTELFALPVETSSGLALVLWLTTIVAIVPFGLLLALHDGLSWAKLRAMERELEGS